VVLVVDAKSAAYSMAALLSGFIHFREDICIAGIIFNKVGSEKHFQMLRQVCEDLHVDCFGYLPKNAALEQGSRYLGLDFSEKAESQKLIQLLEEHVAWKKFLIP
jgi:cobyrinic acid a,c-diamide synthase